VNPTINVSGNSAPTISAPVILSNNTTITTTASGDSLLISGGISGGSGLAKSGAGTLTLSGTNAYTGTTTVNAGTLQITGTGSLTATTAVNINNGGTLLLTATGASNPLNTGAAVTVGGGTSGTLSMQGVSNSTGTSAGALTLSNNSIIDFGTGSGNTLTFASLASLGTSISIWNWSGSYYSIGANTDTGADTAQDRLLFSTGSFTNGALFSQITFFSDNGSTVIGQGESIAFGGGGFEIVAVPEPTTVLGGLLLLGLIGYRERRRVGGLVRRFMKKQVA
jgi:autotransporter-associated beta strand protein